MWFFMDLDIMPGLSSKVISVPLSGVSVVCKGFFLVALLPLSTQARMLCGVSGLAVNW